MNGVKRMNTQAANKQRLDLLAELIEVLPREKQRDVMTIVMDIADSAYEAGKDSGNKHDLYAGPSLPNINIYPNRSK